MTSKVNSRDAARNALARILLSNTNRLDVMDEGTFLENYLISLETLPNDVRRDFELVITLTSLTSFTVVLHRHLRHLADEGT